jgi:cobalt-zinc-cadmium efflux system protein
MIASLSALPFVAEVHDLHVWTLTSGMEVASAHLTVAIGADQTKVLQSAQEMLASRYGIEHATLQLESAGAKASCHELSW